VSSIDVFDCSNHIVDISLGQRCGEGKRNCSLADPCGIGKIIRAITETPLIVGLQVNPSKVNTGSYLKFEKLLGELIATDPALAFVDLLRLGVIRQASRQMNQRSAPT